MKDMDEDQEDFDHDHINDDCLAYDLLMQGNDLNL